MMQAFKITLGIMMGWFVSLFIVFLAVLFLHVLIFGGFTLYHWLELQH